jgi:hypothetical protein
MCHSVNESTAWQCRCGYEFGQDVDKTLVLLRDQRINARIMLGVLVVIDLAAVGALMFLPVPVPIVGIVLGFAGLFGMTARVARRLSITRGSIRQLEQRVLPKVTLHKG